MPFKSFSRQPPPQENRQHSRRLDSWKEIAAYFGRDERTVRRWERTEGLPVRRHVHRARGSVYAFPDELDQWRARRGAPIAAPTTPPPRSLVARITIPLLVISAALALLGWVVLWNKGAPLPPLDLAETDASRWLRDPVVRENFLVAQHQLDRRVGLRQQALESLEAVVKIAPEFPEAQALLAEAYLREAIFEPSVRTAAWTHAEAAARRALRLDDRLAIAHATLARILLYRDWNWTAAAAESQRAIDLAPDSPHARSAYAACLRAAGRLTEAILERERAHRADPLNPQWLVFLGDENVFAHRYEDAIRAYTLALDLERNYLPAVAGLADAYARQERHEDAAAWQSRALMLRGDRSLAAAFDEVWQRAGSEAALRWLDQRTLENFERAPHGHLWDLAYMHARLGRREAALAFLEQALDRRETGMLQARVDPDLDSLRADRRFNDLIRRVGPE